MLDVIMDGNEGEMEEFGPSLSEDLIIQTFPFSVVVPAALEARNKLSAEKGKAPLPQLGLIYNVKNGTTGVKVNVVLLKMHTSSGVMFC